LIPSQNNTSILASARYPTRSMHLTSFLAVSITGTLLTGSNAISDAKAMVENRASSGDIFAPIHSRLLRRAEIDENEAEEERVLGKMKDKMKAVAEKLNPVKGAEKMKEKVQETAWSKLVKHLKEQAKREGKR
ncbi:hypothetical protein F441_02731, partial [Phytophthora nicotianae CJ01A1]